MVTLKSIANSIEPDWSLNQWFQWPPNIFALMSVVIQRTGCYKICLVDNPWWEEDNWHTHVKSDAQKWVSATNTGLSREKMTFNFSEYKLLKKYKKIIEQSWPLGDEEGIDLNDLRSIKDQYQNASDKEKQLKNFAIAIVSILAIADTCCAGFGLLSHAISKHSKDDNLFRSVANILLTTTGSLSTITKFHGTVLPKMRTPQSGIVVRSMSHHLTFHATEVEIAWRTFPWLQDNKNALNVMVVPYPYKVHKTDFEIVEENYHSVRYFKGRIPQKVNKKFLCCLVDEIYKKAASNNSVDILVFPEMSLSEKEYYYLLNKLSKTYSEFNVKGLNGHNGATSCHQLPIIIAGILHGENNDSLIKPVHNEVRMAVFFAGKWFDITQRKHHRWQLDRNQITQYGLEGYFPTDRKWFELCSVLQRRLTVLAPNGWLALTALICEDLARQEPVTEVIRGIGPTLLIALLSDGPQLDSRWSSRYASVLADDPGTSVLSVTSKGMAKRSRRAGQEMEPKTDPVVVALWKDMVTGLKSLRLDEGSTALMFTISVKMEKEFTLDGRSDETTSSVLNMDSIFAKQISWPVDETEEAFELDDEDREMLVSNDFGNWHNTRMLSALSYVVDSVTDLFTQKLDDTVIFSSLKTIFDLWNNGEEVRQKGSIYKEIKSNIVDSWNEPGKLGTAAISMDLEEQNKRIGQGITLIMNIVEEIMDRKRNAPLTSIFDHILSVTKKKITKLGTGDDGLQNTVALTFVYNLHTKLSSYKTPEQLNYEPNPDLPFSPKDAMRIADEIRKTIKKCMTGK